MSFQKHWEMFPGCPLEKSELGYAEVGSDGDVGPYADQLFYSVNANPINNPSGTPVTVGTSGATLPNPNLRPMTVSETEVGIELRLFNSRVNLDLAVYKKITIDQIVTVQISDASGFVNTRINSGKSGNRGFEVLVILSFVEKGISDGTLSANTSYNITEVVSILPETPGERVTIGTHPFNGEVRVVVGEEMGQIAGFGYSRSDKGQMSVPKQWLTLTYTRFCFIWKWLTQMGGRLSQYL